MSHCEYESKVHAYYDGELAPRERRRIEEHLAECGDCRAEMARLRRLGQLLAEVPAPASPAEMLQRLHGAVGASPERRIIRLCRTVAAVAASVLALSGALLLTGAVDGPVGLPAEWEVAAVMPQTNLANTENATPERVALWIIEDLSEESRR